jgi:hypothetical protein
MSACKRGKRHIRSSAVFNKSARATLTDTARNVFQALSLRPRGRLSRFQFVWVLLPADFGHSNSGIAKHALVSITSAFSRSRQTQGG